MKTLISGKRGGPKEDVDVEGVNNEAEEQAEIGERDKSPGGEFGADTSLTVVITLRPKRGVDFTLGFWSKRDADLLRKV